MFKNILLVITLSVLTGCVATSNGNSPSSSELNTINTNIANLEKSLATQIADSCKQDNQQLAAELSLAMQKASKTAGAEKEVVYVERCSAAEKSKVNSNKMVVGEVERVFFVKEKINFDARVDTGAVTSSIGVYNETSFERDGDDWIRFNLSEEKDAKTYEYPVSRIIKIVQQTSTESSRRPVIEMKFEVGKETFTSEFSLADRSHLEYQVLIGREFLRDIAVVDVSGKYLLGGK